MAYASSSLSFSHSVSNGSALLADPRRPAAAAPLPRGLTPVAVAVAPSADLESRSLGELRALARQRGLRGDTRAELIQLLSTSSGSSASSNGSYTSGTNGAASSRPPAAPAGGAPGGLDLRSLQAMPLAQLRAVARTKGVQGNTRDQIIQALTGSVPKPAAAAPASYSAPTSTPSSSTSSPPAGQVTHVSSVPRQQLQSKSLPVLRAIARSKGIANYSGLSKEQLINALAGPPESTHSYARVSSVSSAPSAYPPPASPPLSNGSAVSGPAAGAIPQQDLNSLSLSQLRQLGKQYGIRGDTRTELIGLLSGATGSSKPAPAYSPASPKATATTFADPTPQTLPLQSESSALPPFQSVTPEGGLSLERVKLASEVSALRKSLEEMEQRDKALEAEKDSLVEQANFLRNVLVGGIGLAVVPLLLPFQTVVTTSTTTASLAPAPVATTPVVEPVAPPAPPPPVIREVSPEDYCSALPSDLLSPQVAKFCEALIDPSF